jgi:hypothetical protein
MIATAATALVAGLVLADLVLAELVLAALVTCWKPAGSSATARAWASITDRRATAQAGSSSRRPARSGVAISDCSEALDDSRHSLRLKITS